MTKAQSTAAKPSPQPEQTRVGVALILISPTGQFLISRRASEHGYDMWSLLPGGHVEFNEDPIDTIRRESFEEVGLHVDTPTLMDVTSDYFEESGRHYITLFYATRIADINRIQNKEPDKQAELRWVYYDELPDLLFPPLRSLVNKLGIDGLKHMLATYPR